MYMRMAQLGGFTVHLSGGTDGKGGGNGPVVVLLHGFGAPGNDLVPLADVLNVPTGTRFVFPEGPLTLSFGPRDARAWWLIDMARMAQDQAAGRPRDLSNEIPKGLAPARDTMLTFLKEVEHTFNADPHKTVLGGFSQGAMLTKLSREMVQALGAKDHDVKVKQIQHVIDEVEANEQGAFVPFYQQPVIESSLYGVVAVLQYWYLK